MIGIHRLEGFYWVARTGGYARAARAFPYPITQPAVHQQVKKLEAELGVALFERAGKSRLLLTPAGKRLFEFIEPFYEQLPVLVRTIGANELVGELRIGTPSMYLLHLLPDWVKHIRHAHPGLNVVIEEMRWGDCDALIRGDLDILVDYLAEIPDSLASMQVATLRPFLVIPADHRLADRKHVTLSDMADEAFVGYLPGHLRDLQQRALTGAGIEPPQTLTASSADAILGFVAAGLGYSLLGWIGEQGPRQEGVVVHPMRSPKIEFPVWALWRKEAPENRMLDVALEAAPRA